MDTKDRASFKGLHAAVEGARKEVWSASFITWMIAFLVVIACGLFLANMIDNQHNEMMNTIMVQQDIINMKLDAIGTIVLPYNTMVDSGITQYILKLQKVQLVEPDFKLWDFEAEKFMSMTSSNR